MKDLGNIQRIMKRLFGNSSYVYCLVYYFTMPNITKKSDPLKFLAQEFFRGWISGYIDDNGCMTNQKDYIKLISGISVKDVRKTRINDLSELPQEDDILPYIVKYKKEDNHKWVVADRNKIIFDPSGGSEVVREGKPYSYIKFIY